MLPIIPRFVYDDLMILFICYTLKIIKIKGNIYIFLIDLNNYNDKLGRGYLFILKHSYTSILWLNQNKSEY